MTKILALDTSSEACSVALFNDGEVSEHFEWVPRQHTKKLLPMVDRLLADAGTCLTDLDAIGFGAGPGSFTGLRITAGVAQGLAFGADLPMVPVSTLQALALEAHQEWQAEHVFAGLDARMGELYWGAFKVAAGQVEVITAEQVCPPESISIPSTDLLQGTEWTGIGPGWNYREQLPSAVSDAVARVDAERQPRAGAMVRLAASAFEAGNAVAAELAKPVYLRDTVAWKKSNHRER